MTGKIILGSQSPRRKELLGGAGFSFDIISPDVDETEPEGMDVYQVPEYLSVEKNKAIREKIGDEKIVVLTADTIVILDNRIIGKPADEQEARRMLWKLQGRMHEVVTGVCITGGERKVVFSDTTKVYFNALSEQEIKYYVERFQPYDKAGSYAIQEWIGYVGVSRIEGCFYNVMGLPIPKVYHLLRDWQP
jgi:septum formation protein